MSSLKRALLCLRNIVLFIPIVIAFVLAAWLIEREDPKHTRIFD